MDLRPFVVALCFMLVSPVTGLWWAVSSQVLADPNVMCRRTRRLRPRLADTCRKEPGLVRELAKGAQLGTRECQFQFRNRRWNCTTARRSLRRVLLSDTRESGFVNAITAAGVTYALTRACTTGNLLDCGCEKKSKGRLNSALSSEHAAAAMAAAEAAAVAPGKHLHRLHQSHTQKQQKRRGRGGSGGRERRRKTSSVENAEVPSTNTVWHWGGCGDNVNYGVRKSREWMDAPYRKRSDIKTLVMLHNNEAGRLAIKQYMRLECKCHGLSGSCTMRTCWSKMPPFRDVGNRLKEHFDGAIKVLPSNDGRSFMPAGDSSIKPPGREDLVYSEDSPDFCRYNERTGSLGTQGRTCNGTSAGVGGCDLLCCNRGHDSKHVKDKINCRCRFKWCCEVMCDTCTERRTIHTCR